MSATPRGFYEFLCPHCGRRIEVDAPEDERTPRAAPASIRSEFTEAPDLEDDDPDLRLNSRLR